MKWFWRIHTFFPFPITVVINPLEHPDLNSDVRLLAPTVLNIVNLLIDHTRPNPRLICNGRNHYDGRNRRVPCKPSLSVTTPELLQAPGTQETHCGRSQTAPKTQLAQYMDGQEWPRQHQSMP